MLSGDSADLAFSVAMQGFFYPRLDTPSLSQKGQQPVVEKALAGQPANEFLFIRVRSRPFAVASARLCGLHIHSRLFLLIFAVFRTHSRLSLLILAVFPSMRGFWGKCRAAFIVDCKSLLFRYSSRCRRLKSA
jgi:hypothetical protein